MEEWKPIKGYEGLYEVSNMGRVRSLRNNHGIHREHIMKPNKTKCGYLRVGLRDKEGKRKWFSIHRLVLSIFNPIDGMENLQVDHINTIKTDNRVENLRFVTAKENINNPLTKDKMSGENNPMFGKHFSEETKAKMSEAKQGKYDGENNPRARKVYCIETGKTYTTIKECAEELGLFATTISKVCKGKCKSYKGYHFKYAD